MIVFATTKYHERFMQRLEGSVDLGECQVRRFSDGEMRVEIMSDVRDQDCLVIGSTAPPDEQLLALTSTADALKRNGAKLVRAFLPYLGYGRQDKPQPGESGGIALIGELLKTAGIDEVITIDTHSHLDAELIGLPLISISSAALFAPPVIALETWQDATVVAPDEGATSRAQEFASRIGSSHPPTHMVKLRTNGVKHLELVGSVSEKVILIDDILDTGTTLVSACELLKSKGVKEIMVIATHGIFTGDVWRQLFSLGVSQLLVSDSQPQALEQDHPAVQVITIQPQLWIEKGAGM